MQEEHGYSDDRRAARDALFALLGAGVLVAAAPARRRKALSLLAILAVLALFLLRRALETTESTQVASPESQPETASSDVQDPQVEEVALEEPVAEAAVEEAAAEATEDVAVEETAVEETAVEEVAAEVETAPAEAEAADERELEPAETPAEEPVAFEALDAALAALIGELERVEASRLEEIRIEEAQRAWREAQAEDAREHEEAERQAAEAREREEESALVHAGRQLVHAGGSESGGYESSLPELDDDGPDVHPVDGLASDDEFHLPEPEAEAEPVAETETQDEAPEPLHPDLIADLQVPVAPEADAEPQPAAAPGGLVGLIGRYSHSHREPARTPVQPAAVESPAAGTAVESAREEEQPPPRAAEEAKPATRESDWL